MFFLTIPGFTQHYVIKIKGGKYCQQIVDFRQRKDIMTGGPFRIQNYL